jgi:cysteinyl-tRNA synthetase
MGEALLGETFDIHGGGIDLVFPHHENEIAQSESAHHGAPLAKVWMHNGFLEVEGQKMSKSLGNFITMRQLRQDWRWPPEAIRFNMLRTYYRHPIDWTLRSLKESLEILNHWYVFSAEDDLTTLPESAAETLCDDVNTPQLIAEMHEMRRRNDFDSLLSTLRFLGLSGHKATLVRSAGDAGDKNIVVEPGSGNVTFTGYAPTVIIRPSDETIAAQISARNAARKAKNFAEADRIRKELEEKGIVLKDTLEGTTWELKR